jgi:hypothetical protein
MPRRGQSEFLLGWGGLGQRRFAFSHASFLRESTTEFLHYRIKTFSKRLSNGPCRLERMRHSSLNLIAII